MPLSRLVRKPEIDTFKWAWKAGMNPSNLKDVKVVGEKIENVRQQFQRAQVYPYAVLADWYGPPCGPKASV